MNKAILVAHKEEDSVNEALELCESAGYKVVHVLQQKYMDRPKFGIGTEALEKLEEMAEKLDPDVIIYDEILKSKSVNFITCTTSCKIHITLFASNYIKADQRASPLPNVSFA